MDGQLSSYQKLNMNKMSKKIVIVTGANRGIGLAICQALAKRSEAYEIYATSRSAGDLNLQQHTKLSKFHYPKLDISSTSSIDQLRATIEKDHGHVDIVINNAGVNLNRDPSEDRVERTMDTNYRGTLHMCQAFIPILSKDGRIVNVSSIGSSLGQYSSEVAARFRSAHKQMTLEQLEAFAKEYEKACKENTTEKLGFCPPNKPYSFSKASMNALTAILARENPGLTINCCCPGWVDTEMGHQVGHPPKKPEDGAKIPLHLALDDINGVTGQYWANEDMSSADHGKVMKW